MRAVHSDDSSDVGSSAYFIQKDPWLAYQLGRNLNFREFRTRDGVFDDLKPGENALTNGAGTLAGPMPDGTTTKITANNQTSCLGCHNLPNGNPGGGANFAKDAGTGRNSPHYYGAGIVEMLAIQIRQQILDIADTDQNGWISIAEANAAPTLDVSTGTGFSVNYGEAAPGANGKPQLNNIFRVWYVDANGEVVLGATSLNDPGVAGYNFNMVVWGQGQGIGRSALNPTNRVFFWDPMVAHSGMAAYDPTTIVDVDNDGVSEPSLPGAIQFPATHRPGDPGLTLDPLGFSRDDPDGDGYLNEVSEGDLDLAEWFMLNAPTPAFAGTRTELRDGIVTMALLGCAECHVPNWQILPADGKYAGDRRFFDLATGWNAAQQRIEGRIDLLSTVDAEGHVVPNRQGFRVVGLFSDFKHHDMGEGFKEVGYDGVENTVWRTSFLWGTGTSFPWGHDGASLTLEDAILRHNGEGEASRQAYLAADQATKDKLLGFLRKLVLYDIETLPTDVDGDGQIAANFMVAGMDTGPERFNPEWLFNTPVQIQGPFVNAEGATVKSFAATNLTESYGLDLPFRIDSDLDGWPDVWDHAPNQRGYKDGVND